MGVVCVGVVEGGPAQETALALGSSEWMALKPCLLPDCEWVEWGPIAERACTRSRVASTTRPDALQSRYFLGPIPGRYYILEIQVWGRYILRHSSEIQQDL